MTVVRNLMNGIVLALLASGWQVATSLATETANAKSGPGSARDLSFQTQDVMGNEVAVEAGGESRWTVVCFFGVECPMARLYGPRLVALAERFADDGVQFVGIDSNQQDAVDEIRDFRETFGIAFPLIKDEGNVLADQFGARRTPEVFVLDRDLHVRYHGRIDDQYEPGIARAEPQREDLRVALDELVAGRTVSRPETEATGCLIGRELKPVGPADVTFSNQVARVLKRNCVECHRAGEIGPFSLTEYDEVAGWAETIVEVVDNGRMPPWHASEGGIELANARTMSDEDQETLRRWVAAGTPEGDPAELPQWPAPTSGWLLPRSPDLVLPMRDRPFQVPAEGVVEYQYFVIDPGFTEDKWIKAAQVIPGNRSVVHHAIAFVRPPDGAKFRGMGWLTAYVPGQRVSETPPGRARRVPAGSKIVFQMHYTPTGSPAEDLSQLGLVFADDSEVTHEMVMLVGINQGFEIPPHAASHEVTGRVRGLPDQGELLMVAPHMHVRGKSFDLYAQRRGKAAASVASATADVAAGELLLSVPRYDFNWQHTYVLADPLPLSSLRSLGFVATFDNSAGNPFNPDPTQYVTWGDQTWEEMAIAFFDVSLPRDYARSQWSTTGGLRDGDKQAVPDSDAAERLVRQFLQRFDADGNGRVERDETPISMRTFGFGRLDRDGNQVLTEDELRTEFLERQNR